jgi:hypothetical protein
MKHSGLMMLVILVSALSTWVSAVGVKPAVAAQTWYSPCLDGTALRFRSGFEGTSHLLDSADGRMAAFVGLNDINSCEGENQLLPRDGFRLGRADVQYEGGEINERRAEFIEDPTIPGNRVLQFWLQKPNVMGDDRQPLKGRVQMNFYENREVRQVKMSVRMYLHPDMEHVRSYPGPVDWLTISEWWNNAGWTREKFPFRISVNIVKESAEASAPLRFKVHAQSLDTRKHRWSHEVWEQVNREFGLPVGRWVTLEYGFTEGDAQKGRFFMAATPEGGARSVIFDIHGYTHHPEDPAPDGLSHLNPVKLYTSRQLVDHVRANGGALQVFWDDLKIAACPAVESQAGSACASP